MFDDLFTAGVDLIAPRVCHSCGFLISGPDRRETVLCPACAAALKRRGPTSVDLVAPFSLDGPARPLIHRWKYEDRPYIARKLAQLMRSEIPCAWIDSFDLWVPIPLHPIKYRERGYNPAELLARELALDSTRPVTLALRRVKNNPAQSTRLSSERPANVAGIFEVAVNPETIIGKTCLLIDDIVTTGSTVREAARVLSKAGADRVGILAFAQG
jgi:competence protein ComFC